ncbi:hypothetical protein NG895_10545 [Aeoliella sp. ICT_H6.2]|uniref:Carboxypeptidase regulatory-like domain-containing protein n=1 Tax=Aeoliella straminimaris TaxID=2954799 RepID=A0A9X2F8K7_9BACT|nr:hypothetical protein [Aeoliella straminimaris]MCO6044345.1 hypothetical protein [Aeoliella straminimaris]
MKHVAIAAVLSLTAAVGCSGPEPGPANRAEVSGNVTLNGEPLPGGTVTFMLDENPNVRVKAMVDAGKYQSKRVPIGKCSVAIETESLQLGSGLPYVSIPEKYGNFDESGFSAEIVEGSNENVDFALEQ